MEEKTITFSFKSEDKESIASRLTAAKETLNKPIILNFEACSITDLQFLEPFDLFKNLKELRITNCFQLESLEFLDRCTTLEALELGKLLVSNEEYSHIAGLLALKKLVIDYATPLEHIDFLSKLVSLKTLKLTRCTQIRDITALDRLIELKELDLASSGTGYISDYTPISAIQHVESLILSNHLQIRDLDFLTPCLHLQNLDLSFCVNLKDISVLEHLVHLKHLNLLGCLLVDSKDVVKNNQNTLKI